MGITYQQALDYIWGLVDYETTPHPFAAANYDLRRMEELLARLGQPHLAAKSVHIAGSKGKGSTAAMVASALITAGYGTGLYISPHLNDPRERIRVDDELITEAELIALVERLKPEIAAMNEEATHGQLTTFELLTAMGFAYFKMKGAQFQVVEVGLGGRVDATNVVQPEVCVITSISLDHTDVLGDSLPALAAEKAGVIKPGIPVVVSPQRDEVAQVIEETCLSRGAPLLRVGRDVTWQGLGFNATQQSLKVKGRLGEYKLSLPLLGRFQLENAATAVAALEVLAERGFNISPSHIIDGMARVRWPGRFHVLRHQPLLVVDGAHNPDSAGKLRQSLSEYLRFARAILVMGVSCDKNIAGIVAELAPLFDEAIIAHSHHPRAMAPEPIVAEFVRHGVKTRVVGDVPAALSLAMEIASPQDLICVTGSLFVVGEAIEYIATLGSLPGLG
ncbi:bifunctional folylpolyglutamate synthase/dihydrofolate synthase [Chloroflexota bacterium]